MNADFVPFLAVPLAAFLAYEKGNPRSYFPKVVALVLYGAAVSLALFGDWKAMSVMAAGLAAGLSVGCGNAIGPALTMGMTPDKASAEWWQKGPLIKSSMLSMAGLGFVRAAPVLALVAFGYTQFALGLLIASTLAAPLAVLFALKRYGGPLLDYPYPTLEWQLETDRSELLWKRQDQFYGLLMGLSAVGLALVT